MHHRFAGLLIPLVAACDMPAASQDTAPDAAVTTTTLPDAALPVTGSPDQTGTGDTVGTIDKTNPFFTALGTNGRSCSTCHDQTTGWSVTPAGLQARFAATNGDDPAFRLVDGATSPTADVSTPAAMAAAYKLLLARGVFRIGLPVPAGADFTITAIDDPYGFASPSELSLFRRPRPSTNLRFLVQVMWDGREPSLAHQATDATTGHAQAASADADTMTQIVDFESALTTAQQSDTAAGVLPGPSQLAAQTFTAGANDPFSGAPFSRDVFTLYSAWDQSDNPRQASIERGEQIFDTRGFQINGVDGIPANTHGTCTTCHDTPDVGDHSVALALDIGVAAANRRTPDLPLYTLQDTATGATVQTTDPGRALVTGKFADTSKFFPPVLRGLAMRAPYFHDGSAPQLADVVGFYDRRFHIGLSPQDRGDLAAFLGAL